MSHLCFMDVLIGEIDKILPIKTAFGLTAGCPRQGDTASIGPNGARKDQEQVREC